MNNITIHGNVVKQPDLRVTSSQLAVVEFSVATKYGKDDKKKTTYFDVKCFGKLAENAAKTLGSGDSVIVMGRMETSEYTKKDGTKGKFTSLIADEIGASCRWNPWVKDQSGEVVAKVGKVGKDMPMFEPEDEEFF